MRPLERAGAPIVKSLRKHTAAFLDVHLMVTHPVRYVKDFAAAGADMFTFHLEAAAAGDDTDAALAALGAAGPAGLPAVHDLVAAVRAAGMLCGLTIKPGTPVELVLPYVPQLDMVLIMTVEPGFGGQRFMPDQMGKVRCSPGPRGAAPCCRLTCAALGAAAWQRQGPA